MTQRAQAHLPWEKGKGPMAAQLLGSPGGCYNPRPPLPAYPYHSVGIPGRERVGEIRVGDHFFTQLLPFNCSTGGSLQLQTTSPCLPIPLCGNSWQGDGWRNEDRRPPSLQPTTALSPRPITTPIREPPLYNCPQSKTKFAMVLFILVFLQQYFVKLI